MQQVRHLLHSVMFVLMVTLELLSQQAELLLDVQLLPSDPIQLVAQQSLIAHLVTQRLQQVRHLLQSALFVLMVTLELQSHTLDQLLLDVLFVLQALIPLVMLLLAHLALQVLMVQLLVSKLPLAQEQLLALLESTLWLVLQYQPLL